MAKQKVFLITMRVKVGDKEIEITGPNDYVERKVSEFLNQEPAGASRSPATPQAKDLGTPNAKGTSPAQFFKITNAKTDNDRVLVATFFMEKYRNAENATAAEIRKVIAEARRSPPTNTNDAVNQNIRKGLLMTAGDRENKMTVVLTSDGEAAVIEMVKAAKE